MAAGAQILLRGGVSASSIFWVVDGAVVIGASSIFYGTILGSSSVALGASVSYVGKLTLAARSYASTNILDQKDKSLRPPL